MQLNSDSSHRENIRWWVYTLAGLAFVFLVLAEQLHNIDVSSLHIYPGDGSKPVRISANYLFEVEIVGTVPISGEGASGESLRTVHTDSCSEIVDRTSNRGTLWVSNLQASLFYDTFSQQGCEASKAIYYIILCGAYVFLTVTFPLGFMHEKKTKVQQLGLPVLAIILGGFVMALMGATAASLSHGIKSEAYVYGTFMILILAAYVGVYCLLYPKKKPDTNSESKCPLI